MSINYSWMSMLNTAGNQFGKGAKKSDSKEIDLTDGLTKDEFIVIDKDKDGSITEEEFKTAFNSDDQEKYKKYWKAYSDYYFRNAGTESTTLEDGTVRTTAVRNGYKVVSFYKNGKMTHYNYVKENEDGSTTTTRYTKNEDAQKYVKDWATTIDSNGKKITVDYTYNTETNKNEQTKRTTKYTDGSYTIENLKTGGVGKYTRYGSECNVTYANVGNENNINKVNTPEDYSDYDFNYNKNGKLTNVIINGKTYKNVETDENGKVTIYADDKKTVIATLTVNNGNTILTKFDNGKKADRVFINSDGYITAVHKYNQNGKIEETYYPRTDVTREYKHNADGTYSSINYDANGIMLSERTHNKNGDITSATFYDEKGEVKEYRTFSYTKAENNTIKTAEISDKKGGTVTRTVTTTIDEYGNVLKKESTPNNGETTITTYDYGENVDEKKTLKDSKIVTVTKGNITTTKTYEDGLMTSKVVTGGIEDGKQVDYEYSYTYYQNGKVATEIKINLETYEATKTTRNQNGEITSVEPHELSFGELINKYAEQFLGYHESDGSADIFLNNGTSANNAWCAAFVRYIYKNGPCAESVPDWYKNIGELQKSRCCYIDQAATEADAIVNVDEAKAGDLALFEWGNDNDARDHVGIIVSIENGIIRTIEGNANNNGTDIDSEVEYREYEIIEVLDDGTCTVRRPNGKIANIKFCQMS